MVEYIEKEAAQKIICGWCGVCKSPTVRDLMHCDDICPQFAQIPAADVRPVVRGKWEDVNVRDYSTNINGGLPLNVASMCCSVCKRWHNEVYHYGNPTEMARFCPNCGADMRPEPPKEGDT